MPPIVTALTTTLGIAHPLVQGPLGGPWGSSLELAVAVSRAGGLGSLATALLPPERVREDIARVHDLLETPFAVNTTMRPFDPEVFSAIVDGRPPVVSFALGIDAELVRRAHHVGARFVQQVHTVEQARRAAEAGADLLVAQGDEAGGFGGAPGTLVLVPQVVDAVAPLPVIAAGGIVDGRGLAAALALGAAGAQMGTRFLASEESEIDPAYRRTVLEARSEDTLRAPFLNQLVPPASPGAFESAARVVRTEFVGRWHGREDEVAAARETLVAEVRGAIEGGRLHELMPIVGQGAGAIDDVRPAAEIVRSVVEEAAATLAGMPSLLAEP